LQLLIKQSRWTMLLFAALLLTSCAAHANDEIVVSAAASLTNPLTEIQAAFEADHPSVKVVFNFGGSGTLRKQIEQGAEVDLFLFASEKDYQALVEGNMVGLGGPLLLNRLVIITSESSGIAVWPEFLEQNRMLAIGTPEAVPAGTYAKVALERMGIWERLQDRIVYTKDVRQVLTLVKNDAVQAGIVYASDTAGEDQIMVLETVNPELHTPIRYFAGLTHHHAERAEAFYKYIWSEAALEIFRRHGFDTIFSDTGR